MTPTGRARGAWGNLGKAPRAATLPREASACRVVGSESPPCGSRPPAAGFRRSWGGWVSSTFEEPGRPTDKSVLLRCIC